MTFVGYGMTRDGFANTWRYRDWVIDAFNQDMPYDLFVKAQIAADLLPDKEQSKKLLPGLGLFGVGPWYTNDCVVFTESRAEERDTRIDVLTKGFLGLTVTCARCHNHKYDPISQKDYYSLAGIFNSSGYWEYNLAQDELVAQSRAYQAKVITLYRRHHIEKLVKMVVKPAGLNPSGRLTNLASAALWHLLTMRSGSAGDSDLEAA